MQCDESKPQCRSCLRRNIACQYSIVQARTKSNTTSTLPDPQDVHSQVLPAPNIPQASEESHYNADQLLNLRLMHHYCVYTTPFFTSAFSDEISRSLKMDIPCIALEHHFLLDAVLFVAMVHLASTDSASLDSLPLYEYRDQALRALRRAVATLSDHKYVAVKAASILITSISFATDRLTKQPELWMANWLTLVLGQRNFRAHQGDQSLAPSPQEGLSASKTRLRGADASTITAIPTDIQEALEKQDFDNQEGYRESLYNIASELGGLIAITDLVDEQLWLERKIKAWAFDIVPPEFLDMVRRQTPAALVILAYYIVLFRLMPDTWIHQDLVSHDIKILSDAINSEWQQYMAVPIMASQVTDKVVLADLLFRCLPRQRPLTV